MLNHFTDVQRSLKDPWEFSDSSEVQNFSADTLLGAIMLKGSDMQPLFTDPKRFYQMNKYWWDKWSPTFEKWFIVIEKEYEPLWDRDGWEEVHEDTEETGTLDTATTGKEVMDDDTSYAKSGIGKEITDDDTTYKKEAESESTTENKVSAFDANTYQPHDTSNTTTSSSEDGSGTDDKTVDTTWSESGTGTDDRTTTTNGTVDTDTSGSKDFDHSLHSWGNWGISQTVQKLKKQELDIQYWNVYEHMSDIFLDEMTVRVF